VASFQSSQRSLTYIKIRTKIPTLLSVKSSDPQHVGQEFTLLSRLNGINSGGGDPLERNLVPFPAVDWNSFGIIK
jgi:hypothetical protein